MPPEPTPTPTPDPTPPAPAPEQRTDLSTLPNDVQEYIRSLRSEAATHRTAQRDVEGERDQLREQVEGYRRGEVEQLAGDRLADVSDLWANVQMGDLLNDDGDVDPERVTAAVDALIEAKPHYAAQQRVPNFDQGARPPAGSPPSLGQGFKQAIGQR